MAGRWYPKHRNKQKYEVLFTSNSALVHTDRNPTINLLSTDVKEDLNIIIFFFFFTLVVLVFRIDKLRFEEDHRL